MSPRLVKFEPRHPQGIEASAKGEERTKGKGEVDGCAAWAWAQSFGQEAGCAQTGGRV